jgi:hypothetical protein
MRRLNLRGSIPLLCLMSFYVMLPEAKLRQAPKPATEGASVHTTEAA